MATTGSYIVKKYVFKPYSKIFPELFQKEKERISPNLKEALAIEHVGSTAVPGLGGKGIIDIAIAVGKANMDSACKQLHDWGQAWYSGICEKKYPNTKPDLNPF